LVGGDANTNLAGALAARKLDIAVGHVEAGLRSRDKWRPFPEEMFRRLSDALSDHWFAPTRRARDNLLAEGLPGAGVHVTGNTVVDALQAMASTYRPFRDRVLARVAGGGDRVPGSGASGVAGGGGGRRLVLLTAHRRESFGEPLREIFRAVRELAETHADVEVVYPVHPNPNVVGPAREILSGHPRVHLTDPVDYLDLVQALRGAVLVLTDSGGIQEEAPAFGTPVLVLREVTERPEGVEAGVAELVGMDRRLILERAGALLEESREGRTAPPNPYGDGRAGERIADIVLSDLTGRPRRTTDWEGP
ncbi:MAG TPA: UDP-N-acetylglucosamine 2-epimerase (non-hydrolyzing), partial [Longimicrobiales bacterium]|nr:UDP-N-acetylglucosamine 2-epimerase (non-hydrolyzing) [Longimicrobiales bacterium]